MAVGLQLGDLIQQLSIQQISTTLQVQNLITKVFKIKYKKLIENSSEERNLNNFTESIGKLFLKIDLHNLLKRKNAIIGNFPYNISTQILFKIVNTNGRTFF